MVEVKKALNESVMIRWMVLIIVSISMAANYYFYDALSPLKQYMGEQLGFSSSDFGRFISAYSVPNVFLLMAVLGGIITDRLGIRITGTTFVALMVFGSFFTAYGASESFNSGGPGYAFLDSFATGWSPALKMMYFGYFLFGLGAETSIVVISKIVVKWFKGKELALALGVNLAIARLGAALSLIVTPALVEPTWTTPIWFGMLLLSIGLLFFISYLFFDIRLDRQRRIDVSEEKFRISDIGKLLTNRSFIFIALLCVTFYSAVFPFIKYAPDLIQNKFGLSMSISSGMTSMVYFGTIIFTPLFGWIADTKGRSAFMMILGSGLLILVHLTLSLTRIPPYIPMFFLGMAFSLIPATMWPSVAKIVDEPKLGTAYGLMFSIQNIGLWAFPILIGMVLDRSNPGVTAELVAKGEAVYNYTIPILMLAVLGIFGLVFAFLLKREDKTSGYGLEQPNKQNS
jgi:MFS family permease